MPLETADDLGEQQTYKAACAKIVVDSGIPILSTARKAFVATTRACELAKPISSDAQTQILLAIYLTSSPAINILAR